MWTYVSIYIGYIQKLHMVTLCLTFWRTAGLFQDSYTILHFHQQYRRVPVSPHPCQLFWSFFKFILVGAKYYLTVFFIYISLWLMMLKLLFMCLLAIGISPLEKCLFTFFGHLKIRLFALLLLSFKIKKKKYIWDISPLSDTWFGNLSPNCWFSVSW